MNARADFDTAAGKPTPTAAAHWSEAEEPAVFFAGWLSHLCGTLPVGACAVFVLGEPDVGPFEPVALWPTAVPVLATLAGPTERVLQTRHAVLDTLDEPSLPGARVAALPVLIDGHLCGALAVACVADERRLQALLPHLAWSLAWVETWFRRQGQAQTVAGEQRLASAFDQLAAVLEQQRFGDACRTLVTGLATQLACDRVSLGEQRRGGVKLLAVSHSADLGARSNLSQAVARVMEEAIDQKALVRWPPIEGDDVIVTREHKQLAQMQGSGSLLTVPLAAGDNFRVALCFERSAQQPFAAAEIEFCGATGAVAARLLALQRRAERPLWRRAGEAAQEQLARLLGPRHVKRKLLATVLLAGVAFLVLVQGDYRVTAPATLEGAVRRVVAAPYDGFIATAQVRAGDVTRAQAVLATLDDRDLRLERLKWASQYAQFLRQHQEAVAGRDRARAQVVQAQYEQARAQVSLLDEQLARTAVRAPFDGIVVKGDLSQSLGAAVRRGDVLFEITPLQQYRVILEIDERDIADVAVGQKGRLVLASLSSEPVEFAVSKLTPVTTAREGRNFFRVEGLLAQASERLRPGMEGVAKIEVEPRRLVWIWTHRMQAWARLFVWSHLP